MVLEDGHLALSIPSRKTVGSISTTEAQKLTHQGPSET